MAVVLRVSLFILLYPFKVPADPLPTLLWRADDESWSAFCRRVREASGEILLVLSSTDNAILLQEEERSAFVQECASIRYRLRLASKEPLVIRAAQREGIRVLDRTRKLRAVLAGHARSAEALRHFSPSLWRQQWRSRLQTAGLLSVPKIRIWILLLLSGGLFSFVIFRLLPSADIRVWPREDIVTQTMNILLVSSGSTLPALSSVRTLPLTPITVRVRKSITFDDISPEFIGTDAETIMTIVNTSKEAYSFRTGTRLLNQAGMIFRLQEPVIVAAGERVAAAVTADHFDLYENVIGARGNVPAGLQWEIPGLSVPERKLVYGINEKPASGGTTAYRTVLQQGDLRNARKRLEQELLLTAKQLIEEQRQVLNLDGGRQIELLAKDDIILATYTGFILPVQFLGQAVLSVPIEGELHYTIPGYDLRHVQRTYSRELQAHTGDGKRLLPETVGIDPQKVIVIEFADDITWIKITVDIVGTEQFVLDPLTPSGATFGRKVREAIAGLSVSEAKRILRNFPEVERAEIRLWPPWGSALPEIPSNITISPQ